jgi:pyruvate dehydrogenase E2 component (dihydrolipoamide acetyltransferase)
LATQVTLPRLGQGMESGTIVRWLKAEGETVERDEPLYELDTEKVTQEVEAPVAGVLLRILAGEGEEIEVGKPICVIGEPGEEAPADGNGAAPAAAEEAPPEPEPEPEAATEPEAAAEDPGLATSAEAPAPGPEADAAPPAPARAERPSEGERLKASPLARRIAKERGVDLRRVDGTGPDGRIVAEDVERAAAAPAWEQKPVPVTAGSEAVKLTSVRRTIGRRLSEAWQAPHFAISMSADMRRAIELRERLVQLTPEGTPRPTYSDVLTRICAAALLRHPDLNAHYEGDAVRLFETANVGLAVAIPNGLVVPVIRHVETLNVAEVAAARAELVARTRENRLQPDDLEGGTFTISNLGMYGVERFFAVLNPPQVAILAVGSIDERPVAVAGEVVVRPQMELTLSCDHRAVDGATASEFLRTVRELLEEPALAL